MKCKHCDEERPLINKSCKRCDELKKKKPRLEKWRRDYNGSLK